MGKTYTITEYQSFSTVSNPNSVLIPQKTFDELERFIQENNQYADDFMKIKYSHSQKFISANNYVGVITMKDGTNIQILPKIYRNENVSIDMLKKIFINMIQTLKDAPHRFVQQSYLNVGKVDIFEIFIKMFIDEVFFIVKRGIRGGYESVENNEKFLKGKILFNEHLKRNIVHKEKNFIAYNDFNNNLVENKLIKSTLEYLKNVTKNVKNKSDLNTLLCYFDKVSYSSNYNDDFQKVNIKNNRNLIDYKNAILWSRVFLMNKSFTSFAGSNVAFSLMFPMEKLFESYVATKLRRYLDKDEYEVSIQDNNYFLFDNNKSFSIRPDIVVKNKISNNIYIFDTKWKILSQSKKNYGVDQGDIYQMFVYQKKYEAYSSTLLYPCTDSLGVDNETFYTDTDGTRINILFIDLLDLDISFSKIKSILR